MPCPFKSSVSLSHQGFLHPPQVCHPNVNCTSLTPNSQMKPSLVTAVTFASPPCEQIHFSDTDVSVASFCPQDDVSTTLTNHSSDGSNSSHSLSNIFQSSGINSFMKEEGKEHAHLFHVSMPHVIDLTSSSVLSKKRFFDC